MNRKIRYMRYSARGGSNGILSTNLIEFQAFDTNGINKLLGSVLTERYSPIIKHNNGSNSDLIKLTDGDINTNNYVDCGNSQLSIYGFIFDLGESCVINRVKFWAYYKDSRWYNDVKIEVSIDKINWEEIYFNPKLVVSSNGFEVALNLTGEAPTAPIAPVENGLINWIDSESDIVNGLIVDKIKPNTSVEATRGMKKTLNFKSIQKLELDEICTNYTLECFVTPVATTSTGAGCGILSIGKKESKKIIAMYHNTHRNMLVSAFWGGDISIPFSNWEEQLHYVYAVTGNKIKVYANGVFIQEITHQSNITERQLEILCSDGGVPAYALRYYNRALSKEEVDYNYRYEISIDRNVDGELITDGLVCHLDGNSGSNEKQTDIWIDKTGNGHDIQLHGLSFNEASGWNDGKLILDGVKDWGQNIKSLNCETKTIFFNRKTKYIPNLDRASLSFLPANNHDNWWTYFDSTLRSRFACYMTQHNIEFSGKDELLSNGIITLCQHTGKRYLYHNGIKQFDNCNSSDMSAYKPNVITTMQVGKHTYNSNFTQTEISDILIYDRVLTELEIEKVTRYLETKNDVPKVNKIYSFNGKNGSNLDKTNIWINDIDLETGLNLYNLKYNEISGFVYGRLRLDGESDYIESIEDYIGALSLSFKWLNSKKEISYLIDLVNGFNGRGEAFLNDLNVLQWSNLNSFYINGELQEATGTLELIPDMSYVFHFNLDDLELSNIAIAKSFDNLNVLACEIECIYIYDRAMSDKEVLDNFRVLDRAMKVEYIIKDKYLIQDGEEIKTINPTLNKINLNELPIKFIRDYIEGSSANSGSHWVEIEAFNSSGVNVARGCTCSASGATEANQSLTRLVDGDKNSANYVGIGGSNKYVQIEFNELTAIDNIKIYHYYSDGRTYYNPKTQISTNGKEWITIFEGPNYAESSAGKVHSLVDKSIETIGDIVISKVGDMQDLSVELFEKYGVDKKTISYIGQARNALIADKPKLLYIGNETKAFKLKETGVPFGEFIEMKGKIDLSAAYINYVRAIDIKATIGLKDVLKFIISNDDGVTWLTFYEGAWIEILKINAVIIEQGMDLVTINSLTEVQLQEVTENTDSLKLAWYMKKHTLDNTLTVKHIDMEYSTSL